MHTLHAFSLISVVDQGATPEAGAEAGTAEAGPTAGAVPMEVSVATGKLCSRPAVWFPSWDRAGSCSSAVVSHLAL